MSVNVVCLKKTVKYALSGQAIYMFSSLISMMHEDNRDTLLTECQVTFQVQVCHLVVRNRTVSLTKIIDGFRVVITE